MIQPRLYKELRQAPAMDWNDTRQSRVISEYIGTFLLCFAVGCNTHLGKTIWGSTSNGMVLMLISYMFGDVSGGHFNPAVSTAAFLSKKLPGQDYPLYCMAQLLGALTGSICYYFMFWGQSFDVGPKDGFNWWQAGLCELLYTAMLVFVYLNVDKAFRKKAAPIATVGIDVTGDGRADLIAQGADRSGDGIPDALEQASYRSFAEGIDIEFGPLAIGFVLIAGGYGAGGVSGGVFNPALSFAIDVFSYQQKFGWSIAYAGYQLMGTAMACVFFRLVRPKQFGDEHIVLKRERHQMPDIVMAMLICEFLGAFLLTVTLGLNVLAGSKCGAWSVGAALMCMIYAVGDISGGHFNPAVTLAVVGTARFERGTISPRAGAMYMGVQFLAAIVGAWTFASVYGWESFSLGPIEDNHSWAARIPISIFFTFVLCFTVLCVATTSLPKDQFAGFIIGSCVTIGGYVVSLIAGGTMNPALTFGVSTTGMLAADARSLQRSLCYMACEFVGSLVAVAMFVEFFWKKEYEPFGLDKPVQQERSKKFPVPIDRGR